MRGLSPIVLVLALTDPVHADPARRLRLGVDGVAPFATWDRVAGLGLGGELAVGVEVAPGVEVTARVAVIPHAAVTTDGVTTRALEAPVVGGARYLVARRGRARGFAFGEVGVNATRTTVTIAGVDDHDSALGFAAALGGGVAYRQVDLRVAAWLADLGDLDGGVGVMAALSVELARW